MYKVCRFFSSQNFNFLYLFCYLANLENIYEVYGRNVIILTPVRKRVKRVQKEVNMDFCQKSSENLKIQIFTKIRIYRTPFTIFTLFDEKLVKQPISFSHPIFGPKIPLSGLKKYHSVKF